MKIWQKIQYESNGKKIKKYEFLGISLFKIEKSSFIFLIKCLGIKYKGKNNTFKKRKSFGKLEYKPLVSVIVPNYNHAKYLRQRLDSIYNQKYTNIEVILLDDCSSDESRNILSHYAEKYPKITRTYFNEKNSGGVFYQWKKGLSLAKGEFVWIAESDDYCDTNFLNCLIPAFNDEAVMLAYCRTDFMKNNKKVWTLEQYASDTSIDWRCSFVETTHNLMNKGFAFKNIIPNVSSAVFRNTGFSSILSNQEWYSLKLCGDWLFYLNIAKGGRIAYSSRTTNYYRQHENNTSISIQKQNIYYKEHEFIALYIAKNFKVTRNCFYKMQEILRDIWIYHHGSGMAKDFHTLFNIDKICQIASLRNPNILIVLWAFSTGGGETFPIYLANQLRENGLNVTVLNYAGQNTEKGIRYLLSPEIPTLEIYNENLVRIIKDFGIDVVQTQHASVDYFVATQKHNFPDSCYHIAVHHGMYETIPNDILKFQLPVLMKNVDRWLYIADKNIQKIKDLGVYNAEHFFKISNGLPQSDIVPISRESLNIPADAFVLCEVSRGIWEKGWIECIEAVKLARNQTSKDIHLILVGNGEAYDVLSKKAPEYVHLVGFQKDIRAYFSAADMGLLASKFKGESFPLVIIDSLLCGKPVIASNIGEVKNMLSDENGNIGGAVFDLEEWNVPIHKLAGLIGYFVMNYKAYEKAKKIAIHISSNFDIKNIAAKY